MVFLHLRFSVLKKNSQQNSLVIRWLLVDLFRMLLLCCRDLARPSNDILPSSHVLRL